ncbi:MAG: AAA family ATPase [Nitrospirae bacterium]|nr:AAA family ATPase [Nitrospirota bacterium]
MRKGKTKTPITKPDLTLEVKNFGPISKGSISLKNLTVLIGPNNSGKSYIAMLVHAFIKSYYNRFKAEGAEQLSKLSNPEYDRNTIEKNLTELEKFLNAFAGNSKDELEIPKEISDQIIDELYQYYFKHNFIDEIETIFACENKELVRIDGTSYTIKIFCDGNVSELSQGRKSKSMKLTNSFEYFKYKIRDNESALPKKDNSENILSLYKKTISENMHFVMSVIIYNYNLELIRRSTTLLSYYFPAGRTGIFQSYRAILSNSLSNFIYSSKSKTELPHIQSVVLRLISDIISMSDKESPLYNIAVEFEKEIAKGEIFLKKVIPTSIPEIQYSFKGATIPLHRTSSTISELAPIILYLKYLIEPGNILIIEEPEAHLHPENQRLMAKLLVRLIRAGVYVIITTHSDFLLEQLSNYLMLSSVPENKKKLFDIETYLSADEIGAYVFQQDKTGGYQIRAVEIDKDDGISDEEFLKVNKALYDETVRIKDAIME